jgi:FAD:protein FMN transferase
MGTFATVSLESKNKEYFKPTFETLSEVEGALSSYKENSPIFILNEKKSTTLLPYTYEALLLSEKYYERSDGYFNIAIGSVTKDLYKFGKDESVPTRESLQKSDTSFKGLHFDSKKAFISNSIKLDLGGMGKGFGVDKAIAFLKSKGVKKAVLALSGDIRCLGTCSIEIKNPFEQTPLASFKTKKCEIGVSTSGNYNRYVDNVKNNHLINPKTKFSQEKFASITLVSKLPNSDLDAYATAASVMPMKKAYAFLDSLDLAYVVVQTDKSVVVSENIEAYVEELLFYNRAKE